MASAVASKGVPLAALLKELLASPSASASARRLSISKLFSADSSEDSSDEDAVATTHRRERDLSIAKLFSGDVLDEATKMRLLLALTEDDIGVASRTGFSPRGWWVSKEDGDAVQLKVAMPGLGKEHVKMRAEKDVLVIKGEGRRRRRQGLRTLQLPHRALLPGFQDGPDQGGDEQRHAQPHRAQDQGRGAQGRVRDQDRVGGVGIKWVPGLWLQSISQLQ